ncbi:hypothetical protein H4P12_02980 [Paracoccus sp. 11-3]|uniref:Uncharacterized protein n=1 Tax=Paracoccus amoyensis TaxID=2760093 RepID=A0A926GEM0_9RHOB|nr:hypothetical protein [Paracoccus amoyensis]MBC9245697.1 hypothetical protein [Paracoccus amoyensis]
MSDRSPKPMLFSIALATVAISGPAFAEPQIDPASPFRPGEGMPLEPATCQTLPDWVDQAPDYGGRISMAIQGTLEESQWDGALAYLLMCPADGLQVMCITYYPEAPDPDRQVVLAGGYIRAEEKLVILDPCLSSAVSQ